MRGQTVKSERLLARAHELRAEGLLLREVADALAVPLSTVAQWLDDPTGTKAQARKQRYWGTCCDCGGPTYGESLHKRSERCAKCERAKRHADARWTEETVVAALQALRPVSSTEWIRGTEDHPCRSTVQEVFGSWNAAMLAAGLEPKKSFGGPPGSMTAEEYDHTVALYRSGKTTAEVAGLLGITSTGVLHRLRYVGEPVRPRLCADPCEFAEMWNSGATVEEIATHFGYRNPRSAYNRAASLRSQGYAVVRRQSGRQRMEQAA